MYPMEVQPMYPIDMRCCLFEKHLILQDHHAACTQCRLSLQGAFYEQRPATTLILLKYCKWKPLNIIAIICLCGGIFKSNIANEILGHSNLVIICLLVVSGAVRVQSSSSETIICKHCNRSISRHSDRQGCSSQ